jgi:polyphosphate kinase 2 (PPK2 family)
VSLLDDVDLTLKLSSEEEAKRLEKLQDRLLLLRLVSGGLMGEQHPLGPPVCVVFEGWDASGKGGCIKRLVSPLDPRHVRVAQFAARRPMTRSGTISSGGSGRRCPAGVA